MCVRICSTDYLSPDTVVSTSVTSENPLFPESNLYTERRTQVWRSSGHFLIVDGENEIIFQETTGVDLTATVTPGAYTSSTLCTAVKSALEAAGDSTYTVTYGSDFFDYRFKIATNGAGGSGQMRLRFDLSTDMADVLGFDAALANGAPFGYVNADEIRIHTDERIVWDFGIPTDPKGFVAIGPRNYAIKLTSAAVIKLQANSSDDWDSPAFSVTLDYNEKAISTWGDVVSQVIEGISGTPYRFWSLQIIDPTNPLGYVELGKVFLGDVFTSQRGQVQFPLQQQDVDLTEVIVTENGVIISDRGAKTESLGFGWNGLTSSEKEGLELLWRFYGKSVPFFISLDPYGVFSSDPSEYIRYVRFQQEPSKSLTSANYWAYTMSVREEL